MFSLASTHDNRLKHMFNSSFLPEKLSIPVDLLSLKCESFSLGKATKLPFSHSTSKVEEPFELIHANLWGPSRILCRLGYRYFVLFVDHYTRYTWVYFLRAKSDLTNVAKSFFAMIETQFGKIIKKFRSDPGGEFCSSLLNTFFQEKVTIP